MSLMTVIPSIFISFVDFIRPASRGKFTRAMLEDPSCFVVQPLFAKMPRAAMLAELVVASLDSTVVWQPGVAGFSQHVSVSSDLSPHSLEHVCPFTALESVTAQHFPAPALWRSCAPHKLLQGCVCVACLKPRG